MLFDVKDKTTPVKEGYKRIEVNVAEVGVGASIGIYLLSMAKVQGVSTVCSAIVSGALTIGNLPFVVISLSLVLGTTTAILIDEMLKHIKDNKSEIKEELLNLKFKSVEQIKYEAQLGLNKKEEE